MTVRVGDINAGKHLRAGSLVEMCQNTRILFLDSLNFTELESTNTSIILRHIKCLYFTQSFFNNTLEFNVYISRISNFSVDIIYKVHNLTTKKEAAQVEENLVFFDYSNNTITSMPEVLKKAFSR